MLKLLAKILNLLSAAYRRKPPKDYVVLMSRQSSHPSREYQVLHEELVQRLGSERVRYCLIEPETNGKLGFITGTLEQLKAASSASVVVLDGYSPAICIPQKDDRVFVIQLWHALGAIKKFGYQSLDTPAGRTTEYARIAHMHENYDCVIASGPGCIPAYSEAFGYPESSVLPLGSSQLDYLAQAEPNSPRMQAHQRALSALPYLSNRNLNVLYAPTLRKGDGYENWGNEYLQALCEACPREGVNLIFSGHPLEQAAGEQLTQEYPALKIPHGFSTVDLLESADVVITDYSSIALDAGFLGKNVCFYVPDYDAYAKSPGLNVDLMNPDIAFASRNAADIMHGICAAQTEEAPSGFDAFRRFAQSYFDGIKPGSAARIADLICGKLKPAH